MAPAPICAGQGVTTDLDDYTVTATEPDSDEKVVGAVSKIAPVKATRLCS